MTKILVSYYLPGTLSDIFLFWFLFRLMSFSRGSFKESVKISLVILPITWTVYFLATRFMYLTGLLLGMVVIYLVSWLVTALVLRILMKETWSKSFITAAIENLLKYLMSSLLVYLFRYLLIALEFLAVFLGLGKM